ncbi:CD99 antigen isoform X3 [Alligator mississippiensis]|uniref:CD99 antigen isoform C n=1 Tax=Alligator mississippiensis TaxID=8496 RepID=A0A151NXJ3_ALLMI|nr:CD99 antigen isoform X3 [Alligator mississippiensis]KYO41135.1 CD99 antigen isoform C [Alligator mississippiensis]
MQRRRLALLAFLACLLLAARGEGDDLGLDLADALDVSTSKQPGIPTKKPHSDDFSLEDALGGGDPRKPPPAHPGGTGNGGGDFKDTDLLDGRSPPETSGGESDKKKSNGDTEASQGVVPGIISAVVVAVVGAVSSFIAYQKKKLCFKSSGDQENVNMESHQGAQAEPPVQRTLLKEDAR